MFQGLTSSECRFISLLFPPVPQVTVMERSKLCVPLALLLLLSLLLCTTASQSGPELDPYIILGVTRSASQAEIKKVYKRLAKEW